MTLPEARLTAVAEAAFRGRDDQGLEKSQGEIDAITAKSVSTSFEPFREGADGLLRTLRSAFGQIARFADGDFREKASFYLGQLHSLAEVTERVRHRRLPREALALVINREPSA